MDDEKILISIIIPVYNAEKFLKQCLDSICNQTYRKIEVILIDDGSEDNSWDICQMYKEKDKRIICVHKENEGPGMARNNGLQMASGDYIMFIDSDDYLYSIFNIERIVQRLEKNNVDLLMYNVGTYWEEDNHLVEEGMIIEDSTFEQIKESEKFAFLLEKGLVYSGVLGKVLRRKMLIDHDIWYGHRDCEDIVWSVKIYEKVETVDWCNDMVYIYRKQRKNSRSSAPFTHENLLVVKEIYLKVKNNQEKYNEGMLSYIAYLYIVWLAQASLSKDIRVLQDMNEMKQCTFLLQHKIHPSVKKASVVYHMVGFKILTWLLGKYMKKLYKLS